MGRSTQFIGLTPEATKWVADLEEIPSTRYTTGMFGEQIPLRSWRTQNGNKFHEAVQAVPWSGGPMILTCLVTDWYGCDPNSPPYNDIEATIESACWPWVQDPSMEFGLNQEQGRYYL